MVMATYLDGQRVKLFGVPDGFTFTKDNANMSFSLEATPQQTGVYEILVKSSGDKLTSITDTLRIVVQEATGIEMVNQQDFDGNEACFDLQGLRIQQSQMRKGIYIRKGRKFIIE